MSKTFISILTVIAVAVLAVGVATFVRARNIRSSAPCINRLMVIDGAKQEWALETGKTTKDVPTWNDLYPYLAPNITNKWFTNGQPVCPEGGIYTLGRVGEPPTCSLGNKEPNHKLP